MRRDRVAGADVCPFRGQYLRAGRGRRRERAFCPRAFSLFQRGRMIKPPIDSHLFSPSRRTPHSAKRDAGATADHKTRTAVRGKAACASIYIPVYDEESPLSRSLSSLLSIRKAEIRLSNIHVARSDEAGLRASRLIGCIFRPRSNERGREIEIAEYFIASR